MLKDFLKKFIPSFLFSWYHFCLAFLGAVFYGFPSRFRPALREFGGQARKLIVIGVTGTNGKSTVVELTAKILEEAGYKIASLSSIQFKIGEKAWPNLLKMTMPGRFQLQKFLRQALDSGCKYAVLEVTSEGIKQYRHKFIDFDVAVFTNLTPEHIEAHGSFEKYREAKGKFFQSTKGIHIINLDDENSDYFLKFSANKKWTYGLEAGNSIGNDTNYKIQATNYKIEQSGTTFEVQNMTFYLKLLGSFNIYNALAAICVGLSQEISLENCKVALEKVKGISGRMEKVISEPFKVFVDYAFTPAALEKVYKTLNDLKAKNQTLEPKTICVLGAAGGGRDKWKRPVLGELASQYCDEIIITNEDPYNENPMEIINQVAEGCKMPTKKILDRREAIRKAMQSAQPEDLVIITGKGSEPLMCVAGGRKISWDDRKIVREEFKKLQQEN
ncbi:UDP-N-acetylmuramoyl-L-alanyl-D-glutamate--2,6-diaminopimelate ligase [Patescibacteria group bacterium]|nr:UDP-N-acetylmuramoyl-L-alanyl-D-glutamate--2,6-diaminopimelate ligase [Patescibacteria group bacterium]